MSPRRTTRTAYSVPPTVTVSAPGWTSYSWSPMTSFIAERKGECGSQAGRSASFRLSHCSLSHRAAAASQLPGVVVEDRSGMRRARGLVVVREGGGDGGDEVVFEACATVAPFEKLAGDGREQDVGEHVFLRMGELTDLLFRLLQLGSE